MWIKGIAGLINTKWVRGVGVYSPHIGDTNWELVAEFTGLENHYNRTIDRYKTEEEANAALDWFYQLLHCEVTYVGIGEWEKGRHNEAYREAYRQIVAKVEIAKVEAESREKCRQ